MSTSRPEQFDVEGIVRDDGAAGEPPVTEDAAVDEAVARLSASANAPLEEQVAAFDAVHRTLQDRLADVDG